MLTRIDHVMIGVPHVEVGIDAYTRMGLLVGPEHACGVYIGFVGPA